MSETLPRWSMPEVDFVTIDPDTVKSEIFTLYESITGRTLATGDPVRLFLLTIADLIIQERVANNIAAQQNLLTYAQGQYLDEIGRGFLVTRLPASSAITTLQFRLSQGLANAYTIPVGFEVTNGIVTFATDEELVIAPGEIVGEVTATCTQSGSVGNDYMAGQIGTIVSPMTFLASASNITATSGGADEEGDAAFAERIRLAPNAFSVAGPEKAYIHHTYSVSSAIIDVAVTSPTPGVVHVVPLIEGGTLPSEDILDQVEAYLSSDTIRPLTDEVHAVAPKVHEYAIHVDYWIADENKMKSVAIQAAVEAAVENYRLWQQSKIGRDISPEKLISNMIVAGAARVDTTTMTPNAFVEMADDQVAQCTGVTVNYQGYKAD